MQYLPSSKAEFLVIRIESVVREREAPTGQSRFSDVDVEENQIIDGEGEGTGQPIINLPPPPLPMTSEADTDTAKQLPENPRQLSDLSKPKFLDPIQFSSFECDGGVPESGISFFVKIKISKNSAGKRSSSSLLSLDPSHTKKQAICSDSFSVSQNAVGGNSSPHPPP
nr:hypothetical protein CFP56_26565 [Quercus suber]